MLPKKSMAMVHTGSRTLERQDLVIPQIEGEESIHSVLIPPQ